MSRTFTSPWVFFFGRSQRHHFSASFDFFRHFFRVCVSVVDGLFWGCRRAAGCCVKRSKWGRGCDGVTSFLRATILPIAGTHSYLNLGVAVVAVACPVASYRCVPHGCAKWNGRRTLTLATRASAICAIGGQRASQPIGEETNLGCSGGVVDALGYGRVIKNEKIMSFRSLAFNGSC